MFVFKNELFYIELQDKVTVMSHLLRTFDLHYLKIAKNLFFVIKLFNKKLPLKIPAFLVYK